MRAATSPTQCICCAAFMGTIPGLIEIALQRCPEGAASDWLTPRPTHSSANGFTWFG